MRIGIIYMVSGFGGSILSSLFIQHNISVGASGALFGLLGAMLSELITNWSIYTNKVTAANPWFTFFFPFVCVVGVGEMFFTQVVALIINLILRQEVWRRLFRFLAFNLSSFLAFVGCSSVHTCRDHCH